MERQRECIVSSESAALCLTVCCVVKVEWLFEGEESE